MDRDFQSAEFQLHNQKRAKRNSFILLTLFGLIILIAIVLFVSGDERGGLVGAVIGTPPLHPATDRAGNPITIPGNIETVISLGAPVTEILTGLGVGDKLIAVDVFSSGIEGVPPEAEIFDMFHIDAEALIMLAPDIIFVHGVIGVDGLDPTGAIGASGITIAEIPQSEHFVDIQGDILFLATIMDRWFEGNMIVMDMTDIWGAMEIFGASVSTGLVEAPGRVFFEIEPPPFMFSFGSGVLLNEIITVLGGENILGDYQGFISVSEEQVLVANPDVIITNVSWLEDPVGDIKSRPGWDSINAVRNGRVHLIDADASSRPSQNIVYAIQDIMDALFPEGE